MVAMKPYSCDGKLYEDYYSKQAGSGLPVYSGARVQRGYGLGSILGSLARSVMPLLKTGAKTLGKQALTSGMQIAGDMLGGQNFKQSAKRRAKEAGGNLMGKARKRLRFEPPGERAIKRRSTKHKRIRKSRSNRRRSGRDIFD